MNACRSVVVSAGLLRIFGQEVAELPLVATSREYQGKVSYCTLLWHNITDLKYFWVLFLVLLACLHYFLENQN